MFLKCNEPDEEVTLAKLEESSHNPQLLWSNKVKVIKILSGKGLQALHLSLVFGSFWSMEGFQPEPRHFSTLALHAGSSAEQWDSKCAVTPIVMSSTFQLSGAGELYSVENSYVYGRSGNPTRDVIEKTLAALDDAKYAFTFPAGVAALGAVLDFVNPGEHVVSLDAIYGGSLKLIQDLEKKKRFEVTYVPLENNVQGIKKSLKKNTKVVYIESMTNPTLQIIDLKTISDVVHKYNKDIRVIVDNTFLTPYLQRSLNLGADAVLYSCTKYLNGHTDIIMGGVTTNNDDLSTELKYVQKYAGSVASPFDCYLLLRGLKTLRVRMREHCNSSFKVAQFLEKNKNVEKVLHTGLKSHPQHELAKKLTCGSSGMIAFYIKNGTKENSKKLVENLKLFLLAASLGADISLVSIPALLSHAMVSAEDRKSVGITDNLIRLHIGLEDPDDLIQDLEQALQKAMN